MKKEESEEEVKAEGESDASCSSAAILSCSAGGVRTGDVAEMFPRRQPPPLGDEDDDCCVAICGSPLLSSVLDPSMVLVLVLVPAACVHDHPALSTPY